VHIIIIIIIHEFHRDASLEQNFRAAALHSTNGLQEDQFWPASLALVQPTSKEIRLLVIVFN